MFLIACPIGITALSVLLFVLTRVVLMFVLTRVVLMFVLTRVRTGTRRQGVWRSGSTSRCKLQILLTA